MPQFFAESCSPKCSGPDLPWVEHIQGTVGLDLMVHGATCSLGSLQNVVSASGGLAPGAEVMAARLGWVQLADWVRAASRWIDEATEMAACG